MEHFVSNNCRVLICVFLLIVIILLLCGKLENVSSDSQVIIYFYIIIASIMILLSCKDIGNGNETSGGGCHKTSFMVIVSGITLIILYSQ